MNATFLPGTEPTWIKAANRYSKDMSTKHVRIGSIGKPRFKVDDRVLHVSKAESGKIESLINADDPADVKIQGYRYKVLIKGIACSVPESSLRLEKRADKNPSEIKQNRS